MGGPKERAGGGDLLLQPYGRARLRGRFFITDAVIRKSLTEGGLRSLHTSTSPTHQIRTAFERARRGTREEGPSTSGSGKQSTPQRSEAFYCTERRERIRTREKCKTLTAKSGSQKPERPAPRTGCGGRSTKSAAQNAVSEIFSELRE